MTDLRTAAQQALEALERARPLRDDYATLEYFEEGKRKHYAAMAALRAALAQQAEPTMKVGGHYHWKHDRSPPLVYVGKKGSWHQFERVDARGAVWCEVLGTDLHMIKETEQRAEPVDANAAMRDAGLNAGYEAAPPQRKPLTDEEILDAVGWERAEMYMKLTPNFPVDEAKKETLKNARAVERALEEKNRGR